jgi:L,D-peptidoglycan transpeptidase YkuD (ErfK/YbiS/YcfS/YnhG family)
VKRGEGDGISPLGCWPIRRVLYRADRLAPPATAFAVAPIAPGDGWCDAPDHALYNRPVRLPFAASHEEMWRADALYDLVVVLGHNDDPVVPGAGSAIFLHVARPDYGPTAGCAALARADLLEFLALAGAGTRLCFQG